MTAPAEPLATANVLTVPADPATEALIAASVIAHQLPERELTALPLTVVQYGGRWSVVTGHPLDAEAVLGGAR